MAGPGPRAAHSSGLHSLHPVRPQAGGREANAGKSSGEFAVLVKAIMLQVVSLLERGMGNPNGLRFGTGPVLFYVLQLQRTSVLEPVMKLDILKIAM